MSPTSPTTSKVKSRSSLSPTRKPKTPAIPPGFRAPPRQRRPIAEMTERELNDLHTRNEQTLASPRASTSALVQRLNAEQHAIEARLIEVVGVETINSGLRNTHIKGDNDMDVDRPPSPPLSRAISAKQRALARFSAVNGAKTIGLISFEEAAQIEQRAHAADRERKERILEKKRRLGLPIKGEAMTKEEREARIWAFMNHKPTESDIEDDSDLDDSDDEDPASWFEDDQDDGRKGQDIVEPDEEDLASVIRIDSNLVHTFNTFYEPRDGD